MPQKSWNVPNARESNYEKWMKKKFGSFNTVCIHNNHKGEWREKKECFTFPLNGAVMSGERLTPFFKISAVQRTILKWNTNSSSKSTFSSFCCVSFSLSLFCSTNLPAKTISAAPPPPALAVATRSLAHAWKIEEYVLNFETNLCSTIINASQSDDCSALVL